MINICFIEEPWFMPVLTAEKSKYSLGEKIRANCSSQGGYPLANLTWYYNGHQVSHWPLTAASGTKIDTRRFLRWPNYHNNNIAHNLYYLIKNKQNSSCDHAGGYRGWGGSTAVPQTTFFPYFCVAYFSVRTFKVAKFFMLFIKSQ